MRATHRRPERGVKELRKGRFSGVNQIYHVIACTDGQAPLFDELRHGRIVVNALKREDDAGHTDTLAFVVMPDHLHWLFQLTGARPMSVSVNTVKSFAARKINRAVGRKGRVWQKGFFDRAIRRDQDVRTVARYIIANPMRAGLVQSVRAYPLWDAKWV